MKWQKATMYFVGLMLILVIAWDVFVLIDGGTESSISHLLIVWSYKYPIFTFASGVLCGHLFWRVRQTKELNDLKLVVKREKK